MASAYIYADGGRENPPQYVMLSNSVQAYGAQAVFGRPLDVWEIRMMNFASNVMSAYRDKMRAENQAAWAKDNPDRENTLARALKVALEQGYDPNG